MINRPRVFSIDERADKVFDRRGKCKWCRSDTLHSDLPPENEREIEQCSISALHALNLDESEWGRNITNICFGSFTHSGRRGGSVPTTR